MTGLTPQVDIFIAAQASSQFVRGLTAVLSQQNVHLQTVFAFEALGKCLYADSTLIDQAVGVLGGNENVWKADMMRFFGSRRDDIITYLRKSSACVNSFLLISALQGCHYNANEVAQILFEMLSAAALLTRFPVSVQQLERLIVVLLPQSRCLLESLAQTNMQILNEASTCSDMNDLDMACQALNPSTMGKLLTFGFKAITSSSCEFVELRGSTGLFDLATILLWLAPQDKVALSLQTTEAHPSSRTPVIGTAECPLVIQATSSGGWQQHDSKGDVMSGWQMIPWMSTKAIAANALSWVAVAKPLLTGDAGRLGSVAHNMAKKWMQ